MYKYKAGMLSTSFDHLFENLENSHKYDTQNKANYRYDIHKINLFQLMDPNFGTYYLAN